MQIGPRIRFDKHTLGNLVKNVSPALAFTPVGALGTIAASAAGDLARGKNIGEAVKGGVKNAAIGSGAKLGLNAAKGALSHLGSEATSSLPAPSFTPVGAPASAPIAPGVPNLTSTAAFPSGDSLIASLGEPAATPSSALSTATTAIGGAAHAPTSHSLLDSVTGGLGRVAKFAEKNPNATAAALSAVGNLSTAGAQNRINNAQADLLEKQANESEYDFLLRKQRDEAMKPLWGALGSGFNSTPQARNPYLPAGV